jgi:hypothetical protein
MVKRHSWSWHDDRQWATSRLLKNWTGERKKWFEAPPEHPTVEQLEWQLEVRSEFDGVGSERLGEIFLKGSMVGDLTIKITQET